MVWLLPLSLQARSFSPPTTATERDTVGAAWVNPELRASNDHFPKWGFREHGITQAAPSFPSSPQPYSSA